MALLPVYNCFHPILRKPTNKVEEFDGNLSDLVDNMYDTLYKIPNGIGLAANQVGENKSVLILDLGRGDSSTGHEPITMINPVIEYFSDEETEDQEGCLSIPTYYENVVRPNEIQVRYYDLDMKELTMEASDFLAKAIQHEVDHLHGKLIFERISPIRRTLAKSKLKKIERGVITGDYPMILPNGKLIEPKD